MKNRNHLDTEQRNPKSHHLGEMSVEGAFDLINTEDATVSIAVAAARAEICAAIDLVVQSLEKGGRLIYVGAGTSGRLGVLDAAECPPTFLTDSTIVQGIIAGGQDALVQSVEGAEDDVAEAVREIDRRDVGSHDVVFGITTGGTTPFVHEAIRRAKSRGASTVFLACVPQEQVPDIADVSIRVLTGAEVLTGSTRMKAGTATKMVLNMVSTIAMVRLGKVYQNLMVDVNTAGNEKLVDRGLRIISELTELPRDESHSLLRAANGHVKTAIVMHVRNVGLETADSLLKEAGGQLAQVLSPEDAMNVQAP